MDKNQRKQIEKRIEGLKKQRDKHLLKKATLEGRKDTTQDYWQKEIDNFEEQMRELEERLAD
jgi:oligoendopeptidase F